jgi:transposase
VTPTRFTSGWVCLKAASFPAYSPDNPAGYAGGVFDRAEELVEGLRQGPGEAARQEVMPTEDGPLPSRWTLRTVRASFDWLQDYSLSGVWYLLQGYRLKLRSARMRQWSPDPEYLPKLAHLLECLQLSAHDPENNAFVFLDEMGFYRWPTPAPDWALSAPQPAPVALSGGGNNRQWRIIGALNALNGQTDYLDGYIVGRAKLIAMYQQLDERYQSYQRVFVAQDNWSIHKHEDVLEALQGLPRMEPVWLPTYSPWLNPIEKLWRWLRQDVLKMHRLAEDWQELLKRVRAFLEQFVNGSQDLLGYVGLLGDGKLAQAIAIP